MNLFLLQQYFKEDNPIEGTIILVGLGIILTVGLVRGLIKNGIGSSKGIGGGGGSAPRGFSFFTLQKVAKTYGLDHDQSKVLEYVLKSNGVTDPQRVVSNPPVLDKHFKRAFKQIERSSASEEEAQKKLAALFSVRNSIEIHNNTSSSTPSAEQLSANMAAVLTINHDSYPVKVISAKEGNVLVECPRNAIGTLLRFPKGTRVTLAFFTKSNKGFSFDSQVLGASDTSFGPALQLVRVRQAKAMTQRRFRRRQGAISCIYYLVRLEEQAKKPPRMVVDPRQMTGTMTDISIGGCAIKTQVAAPAGSRLKIEIDYSRNAPSAAVLGQVLRINRSGVVSAVMHVKFIKVPRKAMNAINALVFQYSED